MEFYPNMSVSSEYQPDQLASPTLDDLFSAQNMEVDMSLEWLSVYVEDCLSSTGSCLPAVPSSGQNPTLNPKLTKTQQNPPSLHKFVVPGKARTKRKRSSPTAKTNKNDALTSWTHNQNSNDQTLYFTSSDPPLLQQTHWLADSELMMPIKQEPQNNNKEETKEEKRDANKETQKAEVMMSVEGNDDGLGGMQQQQQSRRCTHCQSQRTPQWRAGPMGPKTLCNACGVRYKSGRLLPEYRPAKSPTFVNYLHSNSHKKVMEMRMGHIPSINPSEQSLLLSSNPSFVN
ncbi:putative GATA transcription factor 9 [Tripterygium wilfordii]|uniref:Putative GATA transcription factor 9 n=1 Tax=Tripterygium wilfordii TaxID=458696 RepID=A0A7J7CM95_TRIWF|nr:GATA transcription factor 5-like isoform X1 [Tripterygium wilfordii]KAF5735190.1 putative GATA transcription factor 9 [Tripterygium wilfordii]